MFSLGIEFGSKTTGCGFCIVNKYVGPLRHALISLVNDNHMNNNLKEIFWCMYTLGRL